MNVAKQVATKAVHGQALKRCMMGETELKSKKLDKKQFASMNEISSAGVISKDATGIPTVMGTMGTTEIKQGQLLQQKFNQLSEMNIVSNTVDNTTIETTYEHLQLFSFELVSIKDIYIKKEINKHGKMYMSGIIPAEIKDEYVNLATPDLAVGLVSTKSDIKTIFCGVIADIEVKTYGDNYELILECLTSSYYMDTDWEFIKRIATHFGACLVDECKKDYPEFYFGLPVRSDLSQLPKYAEIEYKRKNDIKKYVDISNNYNENFHLWDAITYEVEMYEYFDICDRVRLRDEKLVVRSIKSYIVKSELKHIYTLTTENGTYQKFQPNNNIISAKLKGVIKEVSRNSIRVHLDIDKVYKGANNKFIPYAGGQKSMG